MTLLTPSYREYELQSKYITEALKLLGQECRLYYVESKENDMSRDNIITYYDHVVESTLLFEDSLEVKLKGRKWMKERDESIIAYISMEQVDKMEEGVIVEIDSQYFNDDTKFLVTNIFGQVNTTFIRVKLVPYRKSLRTNTSNEVKKTDEFIVKPDTGIKRSKPFLKRDIK